MNKKNTAITITLALALSQMALADGLGEQTWKMVCQEQGKAYEDARMVAVMITPGPTDAPVLAGAVFQLSSNQPPSPQAFFAPIKRDLDAKGDGYIGKGFKLKLGLPISDEDKLIASNLVPQGYVVDGYQLSANVTYKVTDEDTGKSKTIKPAKFSCAKLLPQRKPKPAPAAMPPAPMPPLPAAVGAGSTAEEHAQYAKAAKEHIAYVKTTNKLSSDLVASIDETVEYLEENYEHIMTAPFLGTVALTGIWTAERLTSELGSSNDFVVFGETKPYPLTNKTEITGVHFYSLRALIELSYRTEVVSIDAVRVADPN